MRGACNATTARGTNVDQRANIMNIWKVSVCVTKQHNVPLTRRYWIFPRDTRTYGFCQREVTTSCKQVVA